MAETRVDRTLRNILHVLQSNPANYRRFGAYWWPIKALLRARFGRDQLYMLGQYEDPDGASRVPAKPAASLVASALETYSQNARFGLGRPMTEDEQGEPYYPFDEDAAT